jgi:LysR family nitrogen assimilation transcriptional regulator
MLIELAVAKVGHTLEPTLEADGLPIIKAMVERGLGFTTLTQAAVTREVANGTLRAIPIRSPAIRWDLDIACRRDRQPSEAAVELMRIIGEEVHSLVRARIWTGSPHLLD